MTSNVLPTLYKDSQQWQCRVDDWGTYSEIIVTYGKTGGKMQNKITLIKEGKNKGKSNETTHFEQAMSEAESKWKKQKDKLYLEAGETSSIFSVRPMLAQSFDKHGHKIQYPCFAQPKLDGIRCLATSTGLYSRQGKKFGVLAHIEDALKPILSSYFIDYHSTIFDGELYAHNIDFQSIISGTKRDDSNAITELIEYHIYDVVSLGGHSYEDRQKFLSSIELPHPLVHVQTDIISSQNDISELHDKYVSLGYEGLMLRNRNGLYTPDKRSYDLQKVKSFQDAEFLIVGFAEDKNGHAVFECETIDGLRFSVKPQGSDELRKSYLANIDDLIGKQLTVKYFELTNDGVPRFPVGIHIRNYE